jgi:small subunit ribosomal protein S1
VFDKIIGFIPDSLVIKRKSPLEVGERVSVTCIKANEDFDNFVFDLTENIELESKSKYEKRKQLESVKSGDNILGEIKSITSYGIFVSLGFIDGLLHISDIISNYVKDDLKNKNKIYSELLAEYFIKGTKIQVVIESIENEKCSLVFDKTNELNRKVLQEINEKFNALKTITDNSTYAQ